MRRDTSRAEQWWSFPGAAPIWRLIGVGSPNAGNSGYVVPPRDSHPGPAPEPAPTAAPAGVPANPDESHGARMVDAASGGPAPMRRYTANEVLVALLATWRRARHTSPPDRSEAQAQADRAVTRRLGDLLHQHGITPLNYDPCTVPPMGSPAGAETLIAGADEFGPEFESVTAEALQTDDIVKVHLFPGQVPAEFLVANVDVGERTVRVQYRPPPGVTANQWTWYRRGESVDRVRGARS